MKTVKLTINVEVPDNQAHWLRLILMDALFDFQTNRGPSAREYVTRRYKESPYLITDEKVNQVEQRKMLAELMRNAIALDE